MACYSLTDCPEGMACSDDGFSPNFGETRNAAVGGGRCAQICSPTGGTFPLLDRGTCVNCNEGCTPDRLCVEQPPVGPSCQDDCDCQSWWAGALCNVGELPDLRCRMPDPGQRAGLCRGNCDCASPATCATDGCCRLPDGSKGSGVFAGCGPNPP
jgi:hypothetical protein